MNYFDEVYEMTLNNLKKARRDELELLRQLHNARITRYQAELKAVEYLLDEMGKDNPGGE